MLSILGTGVSKGISIGTAHVLRRSSLDVPDYVLDSEFIDAEVARFEKAIELARKQLKQVRKQIPKSAPAETASFIDAHLLMLEDKLLTESPVELIRRQGRNAESALNIQGQRLSEVFERMEDPYLRAKKTDVQQVVERVLRNLLIPDELEEEEIERGQIIVANDLTPADTVMLKHRHIKAFVTNLGGPISHTSILARSLGIPAVVSAHSATNYIRSGDTLIVDGKRGALIVNPSKEILAEYRKRKRHIAQLKKELALLRESEAITLDNHAISLYANIELPADIKAATDAAARGIGLYRTEFLFMNRREPPSEEEQYRTYRKVVRAMKDAPITIRTLDLGADKQVDGGSSEGIVAVNPALGLRAVRLCLSEPALFRPQLRAIYRAAAEGNVRIMIPMISSLAELQRVLDIIGEIKDELRREGQAFGQAVPIGGMIEVPAAAVSADLFAPYLDFFSIGTNDLIQYTLAIDRVDDAVNYLYDPLHPAVLRLIEMTIRAGRNANIPVAMCGEMAGDVRYTRLLLGMGLKEFSMHPLTLLEVKKIVRESKLSALEEMARDVLRRSNHQEVSEIVDRYNLAQRD